MVDATHTSYTAADRSYFSFLKKEIHNRAIEAGFSAQKIAELDIVVSEMTSNLHKYATDGEILMGLFKEHNNEYIELISIDNGPGMGDIGKMQTDGYSSTSTMGHGLGSIKRLSDEYDLYSLKGWGTILLSRIYKNPVAKKVGALAKVTLRSLVVAKQGEQVSGDGHYYKMTGQNFKLLVADGLGHGIEANKAVNAAAESFKACPFNSPVEILRFIHQDIRKTRGIVATVVIYDFATNKWKIAGIGNIAAKLLNSTGFKSHMAYNGIVGHNIPNTMNDQDISINDYQQIILCSDGIRSRWDFSKYAGISRCDHTILAAAIYKDFARQTDDMSVIIAKVKQK